MPDKHRRKPVPAGEIFLKGVLVHNPVLVQLIGICPVAAAAVSLRAGALLAAVSSLIIIATHVAASAFLKNTIRWVRVAVYLLIGLAFIAPAGWLLEQYQPDLRATLGIYLPLLAVNSLVALRCEKVAVRSSVKHSLLDAVAVSIGYSAVILLTGFIRELLGSGEILEKPVRFLPAAPGLLLPFGGFLVLGFMAAALKGVVMRYFPKYAKAMGVEISPTAVTMKLKPEEDSTPAQTDPDSAEPLPPPPESPGEAVAGTETPDFLTVAESEDDLPAGKPETAAEPAQSEAAADEPAIQPAAVSADEAEVPPETVAAEVPPETVVAEVPPETVTAGEPEELMNPPEEPETAAVDAPADGSGDIDSKLNELFDYLNGLENETKGAQGE